MAKKSFEQAMRQLEKIIQEMETGDLPLEKAMNKFEEGIRLTQFCSEKLNETEEKIQVLLKDRRDGDITFAPYEDAEDMDE